MKSSKRECYEVISFGAFLIMMAFFQDYYKQTGDINGKNLHIAFRVLIAAIYLNVAIALCMFLIGLTKTINNEYAI